MFNLQSVESKDFPLLEALCSTYSPGGDEERLLPLLLPKLEAMGATILKQAVPGGRPNILATWGEPRVLFNTHLDVVPPRIPVSIEGGRLRGRGACDAKGQIVAQLAAIRRLLAEGRSGFAWLGVSGEESDSAGAVKALELRERLPRIRVVIVGEPTGNRLAAGQKGFVRLRLSCEGTTAHGGLPELGHNAILDLVDWIDRLRALEPIVHPSLGAEVWNLGTISGGRASNVVADHAEAELTLRLVPGGTLYDSLRAVRPPGASVEELVRDPWAEFSTPTGFVSGPVPFGSDLPMLRALAPDGDAILCGPGEPSSAHTPDESLGVDELASGIDLFAALGALYLESPRGSDPFGPATYLELS